MAKRSGKPPTDGTPIDAAGMKVFEELGFPPLFVGGSINAAFFQYGYAKLTAMTFDAISKGQQVPFNADSVKKMLDAMATSFRLDPKSLIDQRTDAQKIVDAVNDLKAMPEDIWSLQDDVATALEKAMDTADTECLKLIEERRSEAERVPKSWRGRLARIRRLRERAKNPTPKYAPNLTDTGMANPLTRKFLTASWPLRMMAYCGRSNMSELLDGDPAKSVYRFSFHHAKMAVDFWEAKNGIKYGIMPGGDITDPTQVCYDIAPCNGCVLVVPFGHGKTEAGRFFTASMFIENPYTQAGMNHAVAEKAWENLKYLSALFSTTTPIGRRFVSLFKLESETSNQKEFRLKMPDRLKSPSAWAAGVNSGVLGGNTNFQWWDDPVPMSDRDQENDRKKRFLRLTGQWLSRMRGSKKWFLLITATLWHNDDAVSAIIKLCRDEKVNYRVSIQRCGGPNTSPKFKSLWEEMYPPSELKKRFDQMRNPSLYAAAYESNPQADNRKIVRFLRLYDPGTDEHRAFLANSTKYMSLDPAATRGEKSDLAGVIYFGMGSVRTERNDDGRPVYSDEKRLRLFMADSIPATQSELVKHVVSKAEMISVDYVMVECRSGFHGTADMFENYHGIDVIRLDPKNKNKEERLRAAAPALENGNASLGLHAVVEFPGVPQPDGSLKIHPSFQYLAEEILEFGICATSDSLDALTQAVNYLMYELGVGTGGIVTRQVVQSAKQAADPAILKLIAGWEKKKETGRIEKEEADWFKFQDSWKMPQMDRFPQG